MKDRPDGLASRWEQQEFLAWTETQGLEMASELGTWMPRSRFTLREARQEEESHARPQVTGAAPRDKVASEVCPQHKGGLRLPQPRRVP